MPVVRYLVPRLGRFARTRREASGKTGGAGKAGALPASLGAIVGFGALIAASGAGAVVTVVFDAHVSRYEVQSIHTYLNDKGEWVTDASDVIYTSGPPIGDPFVFDPHIDTTKGTHVEIPGFDTPGLDTVYGETRGTSDSPVYFERGPVGSGGDVHWFGYAQVDQLVGGLHVIYDWCACEDPSVYWQRWTDIQASHIGPLYGGNLGTLNATFPTTSAYITGEHVETYTRNLVDDDLYLKWAYYLDGPGEVASFAVPEMADWALMIVGVGWLGALARARRRRARPA